MAAVSVGLENANSQSAASQGKDAMAVGVTIFKPSPKAKMLTSMII